MQTPIFIAVLVIGLAIAAVLIKLARRAGEYPDGSPADRPIDGEMTEGPTPVFDPEIAKKFNLPPLFAAARNPQEARRIRLMILLAVAVIPMLVIAGLIKKASQGDGLSSSDATMFPFVPIWIAIFVPLFAARKKSASDTEDRKDTMRAIVMAILLAMLLAGVAMFLFLSRRGA